MSFGPCTCPKHFRCHSPIEEAVTNRTSDRQHSTTFVQSASGHVSDGGRGTSTHTHTYVLRFQKNVAVAHCTFSVAGKSGEKVAITQASKFEIHIPVYKPQLPPATRCCCEQELTVMNRIDTNTPLGFVGIGAMGSRIVRRLLANGYKVIVYNRDRRKAESLIADGATVADTLPEVPKSSKVILSCPTDDAAVLRVYQALDGILAHAARGTIVVEMSTVLPQTSRELAREAATRGVHVLDVAISGSTPVLEQV